MHFTDVIHYFCNTDSLLSILRCSIYLVSAVCSTGNKTAQAACRDNVSIIKDARRNANVTSSCALTWLSLRLQLIKCHSGSSQSSLPTMRFLLTLMNRYLITRSRKTVQAIHLFFTFFCNFGATTAGKY